MSFKSFPQAFITAGQPIVNQQNGQPTTNFFRMMLTVFNRTGAGTGIQPSVGTVAAGGSAQASATVLSNDWNIISGGSGGVAMPQMSPGNDISVWNNSGAAVNIYPFAGASIDAMGANAPYALQPGDLAYFQCWTTTQVLLAYLSTGL